jgi:pimeloyl-ACP methyl ester carboxylesterase
MFDQLRERGFAICGVDVGESYGSPAGRAVYQRMYEQMRREHGLSAKACLLPQSRGGLMLYNWAAEHAKCVAAIGGIYPVGDLRSYPGLEKACGAYGMTAAELAEHLTEHNPIDRLAPLAAERVPILHLHGDVDKLVPLDQNSGELIKRYIALGGPGELVVLAGQGHNQAPEFFHSERLVEFFGRVGLAG